MPRGSTFARPPTIRRRLTTSRRWSISSPSSSRRATRTMSAGPSTTTSRASPRMESYRATPPTSCWPAQEARSIHASGIPVTSRCGKAPASIGFRCGPALGGPVFQAGTSNARRCRCRSSASDSTSTPVAPTTSSPITRRRSPSQKVRPATASWAAGCMGDC